MAFGDDSFINSRRGRGNRGGGGNDGNNRNRNRNNGNNNNGGGGGGGVGRKPEKNTTTNDPFNTGDLQSGNPFDTPTPDVSGTIGGPGSIFSPGGNPGDSENYKNTAWGLLNQGGIAQDSSAQSDWLNSQIDNWYQNWLDAKALSGADAQPWDQYLYGMPGVTPPTIDSGKRTAVDQAWLQNQWSPAMQRMLTAQWQAATPEQRGYASNRNIAPHRVIQFALLLMSIASIVAQLASKA